MIVAGKSNDTRVLQWSHFSSEMDSLYVYARNGGPMGSFNGATSLQKWIVPRSNLELEHTGCFNGATSLQKWIVMCLGIYGMITGGFNGATSLQKWIVVSGVWDSEFGAGFNGATSLQKWIDYYGSDYGGDYYGGSEASMEPLLFRNG